MKRVYNHIKASLGFGVLMWKKVLKNVFSNEYLLIKLYIKNALTV